MIDASPSPTPPRDDVADADEGAQAARDLGRVQRIKEERALQLARRVAARRRAGAQRQGALRLLVVRLGQERYGLPLDGVEGIRFPTSITPLPGAPPFVAGVACLAGEALTVLALGRLLGALTRASEEDAEQRFVVGRGAGERVLLLVDAVEAVEEVEELRPLARATPRESWLRPEQVLGVVQGSTPVLDLTRVLEDPRLRVDTARAELTTRR